ncbi:hypothetical protein NDU88_003188 [Pleurodeles waltl]|uniref:Uncharacterized protein n=1 Tax=Pleurodeles waltl TaxID=8319 RepID=A0AAV7VER1_PLEWA|nr:hypothetical protein NDU88_003188 [Pleurodeles waltl]
MVVLDILKYYWSSHLLKVNEWVFADCQGPTYRVDRGAMGSGGHEALLNHMRREKDLLQHTLTVVQAWKEAASYLG